MKKEGFEFNFKRIFLFGLFIFIFVLLSFNFASAINISSCSQLQNISNNLSFNYTLTQNIDCSDTINWNSGAGFNPIGDLTNKFTGIFDGQGFTVNNLYINKTTNDYAGLFGCINNSIIKNFSLINTTISVERCIGSGHMSWSSTQYPWKVKFNNFNN